MSDSILRRYNYSESEIIDEILTVLDEGVKELKQNAEDFVELPNPYKVPDQYLAYLSQTLGLDKGTGLTMYDRRALLIALGWAYHFKGSNHGLRLIARALWRYSTIREDYITHLDQAYIDLDPENNPGAVANEAYWTGKLVSPEELLRITLIMELDLGDSRRYGELQSRLFQQLLDIVREDSAYEKLIRTYRPGFDAGMSTILGSSQFDGVGLLETAFLMYGPNFQLDPQTQSVLSSLRWNPYPGVKITRAEGVVNDFIPLVTNLQYDVLGYKEEDTLFFGGSENLTALTTPFDYYEARRLLPVAIWGADKYDPTTDSLIDLTGNGHHARFGSAGGEGARIAGSAGAKYLSLPGTAGNYASTPNASALNVTGDIDIRVQFSAPSLPFATSGNLVAMEPNTNERGYRLYLNASGTVVLTWSENGVNVLAYSAEGTSPPWLDGEVWWVRATLDVDNGAGGYTRRFYTSKDGNDWTEFGTAGVGGAPTSIHASSGPLEVGSRLLGATERFQGTIYRAQVYDGIDGTLVADFDPNADLSPHGHGPLLGGAGEIWTINRSTADTNDPLILPYGGEPYLYLPGTAGNTLEATGTEIAATVTEALDIKMRLSTVDWRQGAALLTGIHDDVTGAYWMLYLTDDGGLSLSTLYPNTPSQEHAIAGPLPFAPHQVPWIRVTRTAGGAVAFFWSSDGTTWTSLGTPTPVDLLLDPTQFAGTIYRVLVTEGVGGDPVMDFNPVWSEEPHTSFVAQFATTDEAGNPLLNDQGEQIYTPGETWTISRSTTGRKAAMVDRPLLLFGTNDYLEVPHHADLDVGAGDSLTWLVVFRSTMSSGFPRVISKTDGNQSSSRGYSFGFSSWTARLADGTTSASSNSDPIGSWSAYTGHARLGGGVLDGPSGLLYAVRGGERLAEIDSSSVAGLNNTASLLIGASLSLANVSDMEFVGAAIFRKALTPAELAEVAQGFGVSG